MGDQHRLVVLLFVLGDHAEGEARLFETPAAAVQRRTVEDVQSPPAYVRGIGPRLCGRQQGQRGPARAGVLEGVVQAVDLRAQRVTAAHGAQQPQLLLIPDVCQVPDQG